MKSDEKNNTDEEKEKKKNLSLSSKGIKYRKL